MNKHHLKRYGAAILASTIMCGSFSISSFANEKNGHWAEATLKQWEADGLIKKDSSGSFHTDDFITRAEFITLTNQALGLTKASDAITQYNDVEPNAWYYHEIAKALAAGYINGTANNKINPLGQITNEQAYSILVRIAKAEGSVDLNLVADQQNISDWARKSIEQAIVSGYVLGNEGKINPTSLLSRAQTITLLDRYKNEDRIFAFPGVYSVKSARNVTVLVDGVTLKDMTISGNLILGPEAKSVKTLNTTIKGTTLRKDKDEIFENLSLTDGIYEGIAQGYSGPVRLQVTIRGGKITDVKVLSQSETPAYWSTVQPILKKIIEKGSADGIDGISGATVSSNAIFNAIADALSQAKGKTKTAGESKAAQETNNEEENNSGYTPTEPKKNDYTGTPLPDGKYVGHATGYGGTITVSVTVKNGVIHNIDVTSHNESSGYYENALAILKKVVEKNSTNVDTISGATVTSKGLLSAIENALSKVKPKEKAEYADGIWYGQGRGHYQFDHIDFNKWKTATEAMVEVKNGKITAVKLVYHGDDAIFERKEGYALIGEHIIKHNSTEKLAEIFAKQDRTNPIYDSITSATNSARGYVAAIEDALNRSAKFKNDKIEQEIRSITLNQHNLNTVHYNETLDLSSLSLHVKYLNGTSVDVPFEKIGDYGITCNLPMRSVPEPIIANNYKEPRNIKLNFHHEKSTCKHHSEIYVSRKNVYKEIAKIVVEETNGTQHEIPVDHNFRYTVKLGDRLFSNATKVTVFDKNNMPLEIEGFQPEPGKNPGIRITLKPLPEPKDSDPVRHAYRFRDYVILFESNIKFDKTKISSFELNTAELKTQYYVGDILNLNALELTATDVNDTKETIRFKDFSAYGFKANPAHGTALTASGSAVVTVSHETLQIPEKSFTIDVSERSAVQYQFELMTPDGRQNPIITITEDEDSYEYELPKKYLDQKIDIYVYAKTSDGDEFFFEPEVSMFNDSDDPNKKYMSVSFEHNDDYKEFTSRVLIIEITFK
ncbi:FMN-binding protein [Clostridiales bacterium COT073_COT-073]|nr:FMN-binding protein [Clostridiales bacterium COT073_COT-073]